MIDIVRLLRADHFTQDTLANRYTEKLQNRAADEIERLREALEEMLFAYNEDSPATRHARTTLARKP